MAAYYNENDRFAAQWLRNLIARRLIAQGDVDDRSITEVRPDDLRGYEQCHFFAGIGGWSYALRIAGWPDDRPVWTGSCPCQPFSAAGRQRGSNDERHLWPAWFRLIRECRPAAIFGEQVAGAAGLAWLDHVCADLEDEGYAVAAADLPACSVGAPHRRQRLWFVADSNQGRGGRHSGAISGEKEISGRSVWSEPYCAQFSCVASGMADTDQTGFSIIAERDGEQEPAGRAPRGSDIDGRGVLGDAVREGLEIERMYAGVSRGTGAAIARQAAIGTGASNPWRDIEWIECRDGKRRPTQPGIFPLAHGIPGRVGRLRGYGNAIVPQVAAAFIAACA